MHSCSASSGKPDSNSLDCIVFSCFLVYRDWNRWNDEEIYFSGIWCIYILSLFTVADAFLTTDVSALPWYSLLQMLFWESIHLQLAFFELVDAFQPAYHVQLHLHLSFSRTWGYFLFKFYICIPRFLWPADAFHQNFASSTCSFYDLQILPIKIMHLQSSKISYRRYLSQIPFAFFLLHVLSHTWLAKKLI